MSKSVNWGILSTAHINRRLIPVMQECAECELLAVASRTEDRAREYATTWGIPVAHGSYEALLEDPRIDVIYNSLPNDLHCEWTVKALKAGKHVLCEKPLCLTIHELDLMQRASEESGKHLMEAFMYVHHPQTKVFRSLVRSGAIGTVVGMYSEFAATINRPADNYRMMGTRGGGALWDIGVYPVSFFNHILGEKVNAVQATAQLRGDIDVSFWGRVEFDSGIVGQFFACFQSAYSTRTSIMGTEGRIDITHPFNAAQDCRAWLTKNEVVEEIEVPRQAMYLGEIQEMNAIVSEGRPPAFTLDDSRQVLNTILKLRESAGLNK